MIALVAAQLSLAAPATRLVAASGPSLAAPAPSTLWGFDARQISEESFDPSAF